MNLKTRVASLERKMGDLNPLYDEVVLYIAPLLPDGQECSDRSQWVRLDPIRRPPLRKEVMPVA